MANRQYVIVDIETSGLDPEHSSIIEIGAIRVDGSETKESFHSFVEYKEPLSLFIKKLTGIEDKDLLNAPSIIDVIAKLQKFIADFPVVAHNGFSFDFQFLEKNGLKINEKYDSLDFSFFVVPISPEGHSIKALLARFNLDPETHRALDDCYSSLEIINSLENIFQKKPKKVREALKYVADTSNWWWSHFLKVSPNRVDKISDLVEEFVPYRKPNPEQGVLEMKAVLDVTEVEGFFDIKKLVGTEYNEDRPEQKKMAALIARGFNEDIHLAIEAGTGVGKSKAYLVPAALFSLKNGIPIIISTHTKILQDQLFQKEIAHLRKLVNPDLRVAILKGKQNYICLEKLEQFINDSLRNLRLEVDYSFKDGKVRFSNRLGSLLLMSWALETLRGDWDELPYWLKEKLGKEIEGEICNKDELCNSGTCDLYDQNKCFLAKARRNAKDADIVIVNHAIALSGIILEKNKEDSIGVDEEGTENNSSRYSHTVFPGEAKYIVFDEAHHLEGDATSAWQYEISKYQIGFFMQQLYGSRGAHNILKPKTNDTDSPLEGLYTTLMAHEGRIVTMVESLFIQTLPNLMDSIGGDKASDLIIDDLLESSDDFRTSFSTLRDLNVVLLDIVRLLDRGSDLIQSLKLKKIINIRREHAKRLTEALECIVGDDKTYARYLQRQRQGISVIAAPIRVAEHLNEYVYKNFNSVVMTSATLTVGGKLDFIASRLGLNLIPKGKILGGHANSSFDYAKQVKFYLPEGIVYKGKKEEHFQKSIDFLRKAIIASSGGSLILCSGHEQVQAIYDGLRDVLAAQNILLLRQERDRGVNSVVADFKDDINSVLIGTDSLWEGIDVPGDALRSLFIFKIPFPSPRALVKAREADIEQRGGSWYRDFSEPLATIALKQGFGRLIRKASDKGIAILFDEGLLEKQNIVSSFPKGVVPTKAKASVILDNLMELAAKVAEDKAV